MHGHGRANRDVVRRASLTGRTYSASILENLVHHSAFLTMIYLNRDTVRESAAQCCAIRIFAPQLPPPDIA